MTVYDDRFYGEIKEGAYLSASIVAPLVLHHVAPLGPLPTLSLLDVGCGQGWWAKAFQDLGVANVTGIDGDYVQDPVVPFIGHDISKSLPEFDEKYDVLLCLEVAEHLPEHRADSFVAELCERSDIIVFSAAIPFQTGTHHINCQWLSYWAEKFKSHGYNLVDSIRWEVWNNPQVESWYKQNVVIFDKNPWPEERVYDVVHPDIHFWGRV
jgi:SAM-dependent methyltransferase